MEDRIPVPLRWVLLAPAALLAGYTAYLLGGILNTIGTTGAGGDPGSPLTGLLIPLLNHAYFGAAATYVAGRLAPRGKFVAALAVSAALVLILGASLFAATMLSARTVLTTLVGGAGVLLGAGGIVVSVHRGEIDLGDEAW